MQIMTVKMRMQKMKAEAKSKIIKLLFFVFLFLLLSIEVAHAVWNFTDELYLLMSRFVGGGACLLFMLEFSFTRVLSPIGNKRPLLYLLTIPGFIIAINNFPFVSFFAGDCRVEPNPNSIAFFALVCFGVGFFEEMAFRGCAFMFILKSRTQSKAKIFLAIFLSSAVFGLIHFVNIFFGASPISVLLQIGYSALIGALCSMVLLLTRNIWCCVILHALYNFCGGIISDYGSGVQWTFAEVIFTAIVAVIVAIYFVILFIKMPLGLANELFVDEKTWEKNNLLKKYNKNRKNY